MKLIDIEVAYASPTQSYLITMQVRVGCTLLAAIERSGILTMCPEINLSQQKVGVFSKQRDLSDVVKAGERVEIYRPLLIDPKEARRAKARKS